MENILVELYLKPLTNFSLTPSGCTYEPGAKTVKRGRPNRVRIDASILDYQHRCVPHVIMNKVLVEMQSGQKEDVKKTTFGPVIGMKLTKPIGQFLINYVVRKVNTETETLELGKNKEVIIPLVDVVQKVLGLKNEGYIVPIDKLLEGLCTSKTQRKPISVSAIHNGGQSRGQAAKKYVERLKDDRTTEATCSNFAVIALCCLLATNTSYNVDVRLSKFISSVSEMQRYNWCQFVVSYLMKAIQMLREGRLTYLCGCLLFPVVSNIKLCG